MNPLTNITLLLAFGIALPASAETYHTSQPSGAISKFEALRTTLQKPGTSIYKCSEVRLTEKATFKNVPASGGNDFVVPPKTK